MSPVRAMKCGAVRTPSCDDIKDDREVFLTGQGHSHAFFLSTGQDATSFLTCQILCFLTLTVLLGYQALRAMEGKVNIAQGSNGDNSTMQSRFSQNIVTNLKRCPTVRSF